MKNRPFLSFLFVLIGFTTPILLFGCSDQSIATNKSPPKLPKETLTIAVASNFVAVTHLLGEDFAKKTNCDLTIISGSTGKLYTQIIHGAPFDIFLAADQERPALLKSKGFIAQTTSPFTYASGLLVLWTTAHLENHNDAETILRNVKFRKLALANPALAPYGSAAIHWLKQSDLYTKVQDKLIFGENINQAFTHVTTGNAEFGLIALSQANSISCPQTKCFYSIPDHEYPPIMQDGVLLKRAENNSAASAFMRYILSNDAQKIIINAGYGSIIQKTGQTRLD